MRLLTLCFWRYETTTFEKRVEKIVRVDATGRCIHVQPRQCADSYKAITHTIGNKEFKRIEKK